MTHTTLSDQNKLFPQKLDAIVIPELVINWPTVCIIIGSLRLYFKVDVRVAF